METPASTPPRTLRSKTGFLVFGLLGLPVMAAAWVWYGMAFDEEMTEQSKALSAGTTMEGFGAAVGVPPLVIAHVLGLVILAVLGAGFARPKAKALLLAAGAVAAASVLGIIVGQVLWSGDLFGMSANMQPEYVP